MHQAIKPIQENCDDWMRQVIPRFARGRMRLAPLNIPRPTF